MHLLENIICKNLSLFSDLDFLKKLYGLYNGYITYIYKR